MSDNQDQFGSDEGDSTTSDPFGWGKVVWGIAAGIVLGLIVIAVVGF
jgi:hypothetical protein